MQLPATIEVVSMFVEDISEARAFYIQVFEAGIVFEDDVSCLLKFEGALVNLLQVSEAPELVEPMTATTAKVGAAVMLTVRVPDVDAVCAALREKGISLLNGPIDRPWGRRTAAFADPSGHVWEVAHELR